MVFTPGRSTVNLLAKTFNSWARATVPTETINPNTAHRRMRTSGMAVS